LRLETQPAFALPDGRDPQVGDKGGIHPGGVTAKGGNTPVGDGGGVITVLG
jgi:hypothetical protein